MTFILENWHLMLVAIASGTMLLWPIINKNRAGSISTSEAVRLINREKGVLVDVAEPAEFASGHAAGARNVPLGTIADAKGLPANKAVPIIVICPTGSRASRAVGLLRKAGHENAVALAGGTAAWRDASLPIDKG